MKVTVNVTQEHIDAAQALRDERYARAEATGGYKWGLLTSECPYAKALMDAITTTTKKAFTTMNGLAMMEVEFSPLEGRGYGQKFQAWIPEECRRDMPTQLTAGPISFELDFWACSASGNSPFSNAQFPK